MYRSLDGAARWEPAMGNGIPETLEGTVEALTIDPRALDTVYAGTGDGKVFVSDDLGDSWTAVAEGLPPVRALTPV